MRAGGFEEVRLAGACQGTEEGARHCTMSSILPARDGLQSISCPQSRRLPAGIAPPWQGVSCLLSNMDNYCPVLKLTAGCCFIQLYRHRLLYTNTFLEKGCISVREGLALQMQATLLPKSPDLTDIFALTFSLPQFPISKKWIIANQGWGNQFAAVHRAWKRAISMRKRPAQKLPVSLSEGTHRT